MSRLLGARGALVLLLALAAACQDYNFNPVGHCLIQPSSERVTLSNISTADVLFVIDDSGSMGGEQASLANNFNLFISNLDAANAARVGAGLEPFDFHIAVTSTSVFFNFETGFTCSSSCAGAAGQLVCCSGNGAAPMRRPKACTSNADCTVAGTTCGTNCTQLKGENYCCNQTTGAFPAGAISEIVPCSNAGATCGTLETHYSFAGCGGSSPGVAVDQWPYPRGDFVSWTSGGTANPRVLHFDKQLYTGSGTNRQGFTRQDLVSFFAGGVAGGSTVQGNAITGTCGSGQEQGLAAARLALEKAVGNQQKDTYAIAAGKQAAWNATTRTAGAAAEWPHPNSKLVLVFIGDEDDCSSPLDPSGGVVMTGQGVPGNDACTQDPTKPAPNGHKLQDVATQFVDYFTNLGRPVGAAFIQSFVSGTSNSSCSGDTCQPGICCQPGCGGAVCGQDSQCGGQAAGNRFFRAANELRGRGADVVVGSICDDFGSLLGQIAEIVKPPSGLTLPTQPAESAIALLRIADTGGKTRKVCGRPLAPTSPNYTFQQAKDTGADWWFTATRDPGGPVAVSQFVYINPQGKCIANPGETYSADYLGQLPAGGCQTDSECAQKLGGAANAWTCFAGMSGNVCAAPTVAQPGTCICGAREDNCRLGP
jgi:hypothetical protein